MKVQTSRGKVELTAADVRPGMVFRHEPRGRDIIVVRPYLAASKTWECNPGGVLFVADRGIDDTWSLLGCDPAVAARHNCEVYGIAPGIDAGAHGFARLRDGGAVDLRREENIGQGMVFVDTEHGERRHADYSDQRAGLASVRAMRFLGMDADTAHHGAVERLCCGDHQTEQILDGYVGRTATGDCCTLAIGHDGDHEDIATGARWGAKPEIVGAKGTLTFGGATWQTCDRVSLSVPPSGAKARSPEPQGTLTIGAGPSAVTLPCASVVLHARRRQATFTIAIDAATPRHAIDTLQEWLEMGRGGELRTREKTLLVLPMEWKFIQNVSTPGTKFTITVEEEHPAAEVAFVGTLDARASLYLGDGDATCTLRHDGTFACACGSTAPGAHRDGCKLPWQHEAAAQEAWMALANGRGWNAAVKAADNALTGAAAVTVLAWCCAADGFRERERRAAEAPLVALVNAVPEGLDPVGWRAAVLCCHEGGLLKGCDFAGVRESLAWFLRQPRDGRVPDSVKAYDRAIAPQGQRPAPFRRGAPGLPVDDGRDA